MKFTKVRDGRVNYILIRIFLHDFLLDNVHFAFLVKGKGGRKASNPTDKNTECNWFLFKILSTFLFTDYLHLFIDISTQVISNCSQAISDSVHDITSMLYCTLYTVLHLCCPAHCTRYYIHAVLHTVHGITSMLSCTLFMILHPCCPAHCTR